MAGLPLAWRLRSTMTAMFLPPLVHLVSLQKLVGRRPARTHPVDLDDTALAAYVDDLLRRLPWPWRHTCLKRASVLFEVLRRAGRPVELLIGARRGTDGAFMAHAWLMMDGCTYLEPNPQIAAAHTVVARFPETGSR